MHNLTIEEVADQLQVSVRTIYAARTARRADDFPPSFKVGGQLRWRQVDVDAWIEAQLPQSNVTPIRSRGAA